MNVLLELLSNVTKIAQAKEIAKKLLTALTSEQLVLVSHIDRHLIQSVITTDDLINKLQTEKPNEVDLQNYMTSLVNRLKNENMEQGLNMNEMVRFHTKKRTIRGSIAPHQDVLDHPGQKDQISDLDELEFVEEENKAAGNFSIDMSDDD